MKMLVNEASIDFKQLAEINEKEVIITYPDQDCYAVADKAKVETILINLLSNAFKHTQASDTIEISFGYGTDNLLFCSVEDSGSGISEEDLPHIFDRFFQSRTKNSKYVSGSGIGLAFSKKLAELHQGQIDVKSVLGEGSKFTFSFPIGNLSAYEKTEEHIDEILQSEKTEEEKPDFIEVLPGTEHISIDDTFKQSLVFVVEDNEEVLHFLESNLNEYYKVRAFADGQHCIDALESEWPDLIISDVFMPRLNGIELCNMVKSDIKTSHIPIILLTAATGIDNKLKGIGVGADAYINKPFDFGHLLLQCQMLLKNRKALRERFQADFPHGLEKTPDNEQDKIFIEKLYSIFDKSYENPEFKVDELVSELGINRVYLFQKVKALTNHTPKELLRVYRLKKAAELIVKDKLRVNEVYGMVGFNSRAHFSKAFKEKYDVSPSDYGKS